MKKNRGFSLIELVVSIAILAIVGIALVGFMSVSSKTFRSVNAEVNLQYESQLAVNQLKDLIVDSNRGIAYGLQPVVGTFTPVNFDVVDSETLLLTALEGSDLSNVGKVKRCLMIYNETYDSASMTYAYPVTKIVWDPDTKKLYYAQYTFNDLASLMADQYLLGVANYYLMSEYLEDFSISMLNTEDQEVSITLGFENAGKNYETTPSLSLRNKVIVSSDIHTIYTHTSIVPPILINSVDVKKGGVIISSDSATVNSTVNYTASVNAQFGANDGVQWVLAGNSTYGAGGATTLSQDGMLTISPYELSNQISVTAMSVMDNSKKATVLITVEDSLGEFGYVNALTLGDEVTSGSVEATVFGGPYAYYGFRFQETDAYISYVNGDKLLSSEKGVTWSVSSNEAPAGSFKLVTVPSGSPDYVLNGNCPVYVKVDYRAMGCKIFITATTKGNDYSGNKIVKTKPFTVTGLQEPEREPIISLNLNSGYLSRNGKLQLTPDIQNMDVISCTYEIIEKTGFDENMDTKKVSNISVSKLAGSNNANVIADTKLDWNTSFTFDVIMHVSGYTNANNLRNIDSNRVSITVNPVEVTITPASSVIHYSINPIPTSINYLNLNVRNNEAIDGNYYPEISFTKIHVYKSNNTSKYKNLDLLSIVYDNDSKSIMINNLFRDKVFYYNNFRDYGTNYNRLTLSFRIKDKTNTSNSIDQDINFKMTFY